MDRFDFSSTVASLHLLMLLTGCVFLLLSTAVVGDSCILFLAVLGARDHHGMALPS